MTKEEFQDILTEGAKFLEENKDTFSNVMNTDEDAADCIGFRFEVVKSDDGECEYGFYYSFPKTEIEI